MRLLLLFSVLALIFVNGWTDAPNAIAGVVATGSMPYRTAARMAAACNLSGALLFCLLGGQVAKTHPKSERLFPSGGGRPLRAGPGVFYL